MLTRARVHHMQYIYCLTLSSTVDAGLRMGRALLLEINELGTMWSTMLVIRGVMRLGDDDSQRLCR